MKDKFLRFFMGKMEKSVYIAAVSVIVCLATVIGSAAIAHNHNKKIDAALESLAQAESTAETASESASESVLVSDNETTTPQAQNANNEPAGDKALQYLTEYNKLTAEYEKKKAELEKQANITISGKNYALSPEPRPLPLRNFDTEEEYQQHLKKIEEEHKLWEVESQKVESQKSEDQRKADEAKSKANEARQKIIDLDEQYNNDVAKLKQKYGIS